MDDETLVLVAAIPEAWRRYATEVAAELGTDVRSGLPSEEAADRLERYGPNQLDAAVTAWRKLLSQFADPLIYLLLEAVVVSVVAWILEGRNGVPFEVIVIVVIRPSPSADRARSLMRDGFLVRCPIPQ